jgi:aminopeptidase N
VSGLSIACIVVIVAAGIALLATAVLPALRPAEGRRRWRSLWALPVGIALIIGAALLLARQQRAAEAARHVARAKVYRGRGDMERAEREFRRALEVDPDNPEAKSELDETRKKIEEARKERERPIQEGGGGTGGGGGGGGGAPGEAPARKLPESQITIADYELDAEILPARSHIEATAIITAVPKRVPLQDFDLILAPGLLVSLAQVNGQHAAVRTADEKLTLAPTTPITTKAPLRITIKYAGFGPDPRIAGGDWISEQGTYLRCESMWYPATSFFEFRSPVTLRATVPEGITVVSQGKLLKQESARDASGGRQGKSTFTWRCDLPAVGFNLAAAKYVEAKRQWGSIPISVFTYPKHADRAPLYLDTAQDVLAFYSSRFGPYPYPKFAIAEIPKFPGGYGATSLVMVFDEVIERGDLDEHFIAHEIGHQWWGNLVGPKGPGAGWLSEAFAEYASWMYQEHAHGPETMQLHLSEAKETYFGTNKLGQERAIAEQDPLNQDGTYHGVVYCKGAYVLHMLRRTIGDEDFTRCLRQFLEQYRAKQATIADFRATCARASGQDLTWFFDEWLGRPGCMSLSYDFASSRSEGAHQVAVVQVQQETPDPYAMGLDIALVAGGRTIREHEVLNAPAKRFEYVVTAPVTAVTLDPDHDILMATPRRVKIEDVRGAARGE